MAKSPENILTRAGLSLAEWSERWFPDPLVFALLGIVIVYLAGLLMGEAPMNLAVQGGKAFWSLVPFTMQMVMVIGGYVVASAPPVHRIIVKLAQVPRSGRAAVAWVTLFSSPTALISWG